MRQRRFGISVIAAAGLALGLAGAAPALGPGGAPALYAQAPTPGPYAGQEAASVRGLSEAEIDDLRNGRGMGLARPAELNGYPGPLHVLELADALALSDEQRAAVQALYDQMKADATAAGADVLARYAELEEAFRAGTMSADDVERRTLALGQAEARLRAVHLTYHLRTRDLLSAEQIAAYSRLRGYGDAPSPADPSAAPAHPPGMVHQPGMVHEPGMHPSGQPAP